jgi:hypothetical protein
LSYTRGHRLVVLVKFKCLYLLLLCFLFSCCKNEEGKLRKATSKINTISVIIDDKIWNGEIGESLRNKFASPVVGLSQEEPLFTINQYSDKLMEGFMKNSRTIIVVKKDSLVKFELRKNQYTFNQNVFYISGTTNDAILKIIEVNALQIVQIIKDNEIIENQRINRQSAINTALLATKFDIKLTVPKGYLYALRKSNFIWLKKEIVSGSTNILVYSIPLTSINKRSSVLNAIIRIRDSIGNLYIRGTEASTPMITDQGYSPYLIQTKLNNKAAFETRGTWELKNDFMSGPFVNYMVVDKQNNKILVLEGFCYSPSKEERDLMHELESIIKSVAFTKKIKP